MSSSRERLHRLIDEHADRVDRYRRGELTAEEFRPIRLSYGLYAQLEHTSHLQRIKVPGGLLETPQLRTIADVAERWGRGLLHVTTRQDFQIHWVPLDAVREMYHRLQTAGISTRGACSDSVRNVTASPCAGTCPEEAFDVLPYALALEDYFLFHPLNLTLPRKFKPAFSGCPHDEAQGMINDLAFYAHRRNGENGFAVYVGGGLGAAPHLAKPLLDFAPATDVLAIAEAVVRVQHRFGERKNRHKARLKFLLQRMGLERFRTTVLLELDAIREESRDDLRKELRDALARYRLARPRRSAPGLETERKNASYASWRRTNVRAQCQEGFFAIDVMLPLGDITAAQLRTIADLADVYGNGTIRTTNDQNLLLPFVAAEDLGIVYDAIEAIGLSEAHARHLSDVTSCPGADYCSLAVTRSMHVAERIRASLRASAVDVEALGRLRIKISGCPNSCGQHHVGDVGLTGMMVKDANGVERPHCAILVGGGVGENDAAVGRRLRGKFPEPVVPRVIEAITALFARERRSAETFQAFVGRVGLDPIQRLADAELQRIEDSVSVDAA
jgi:sulfite reductase beta subunit-like hemoprotein